MQPEQHAAYAPTITAPRSGVATRTLRWTVAAVLALALTGVCREYFAVNAGADYPEPWAQASR